MLDLNHFSAEGYSRVMDYDGYPFALLSIYKKNFLIKM